MASVVPDDARGWRFQNAETGMETVRNRQKPGKSENGMTGENPAARPRIIVSPLNEACVEGVIPLLKEHLETPPGSGGGVDEVEYERNLRRILTSLEKESRDRFFVARAESGGIVGMVGYRPVEDRRLFDHVQLVDGRAVSLQLFHIASAHRRKGIGRMMLEAVERAAGAEGIQWMIVDSGPRYMLTGWKFYDRTGYIRKGRIPEFYADRKGKYFAMVWIKALCTREGSVRSFDDASAGGLGNRR